MEEEVWKDIYFIENGVIWDYRGLYQVSNLGNVRSLNYRGQIGIIHNLSPGRKENGYLYVHLVKNKQAKNHHVHRLVAHMFIENDDPKHKVEVNHINEFEKDNNRVDNLEWCTPQYNHDYGTRAKRQAEKMKGRKRSEESKRKQSEATKGKPKSEEHRRKMTERIVEEAKKQRIKVIGIDEKNNKVIILNYIAQGKLIGVDHSSISRCCKGKQHTAGGYKWYYLEEYPNRDK